MGASEPGEVIKLFDKFFSSGDMEGLMTLYEDGAVMPGEEGPVEGKAGIREALQGFLSSGAKLRFGQSAVFQAGDLALTHNAWTMDNPDGTTQEAVTAEVVRRQQDGTWKYILDNPFGGGILQQG
jgi:ketosteroid isomerase-like protein